VIVSWTPEAVGDVATIHRYVGRFNPMAAVKLVQSLYRAGDSLADFPERGRRGLSPGTRELVVYGTYVLVYRLRAETIEIVRVWHGAQER
jgi:addiction module RelE/StbE family toxin